MRRIFIMSAVACVLLTAGPASRQALGQARDGGAQVVEYDAGFFERYRPNTALDMVRQLPGFQLDDGTGNRGFAAAVGNILINNRRLSAKQDLPSATLARIPASQVEYIQLVRGQVNGIDLQGQSVVANVFLRQEDTAAIRWTAYMEHNNTAPIKPAGSISLSSTWRGIDYNAGIDVERNTSGYYGAEYEFDGDGALVYDGTESSTETGLAINGLSLNAAMPLGVTLVRLNTRYGLNDSLYERPAIGTVPASGTVQEVLIRTDRKTESFELGMDAERDLYPGLAGKAILLLTDRDQESYSSRADTNSASGQTLYRLADTGTAEKERIARLEFDWTGFPGHALQADIEGAYNVLDRALLQTDDRGEGPVVVDIPGANSRVEELRGEFLLQDTWSLGAIEADYGMGLELSSVTQTGDADQTRDFHYIKPRGSVSYSPGRGMQTRLSLLREVSQLNLTDFVSATVFEDNDLALGNPDIRPETTWVAELSHERRLDRISVVKLTAFHHWIRDVLDLLPLSPDFEAPGNIGDGRRWGVEFEGTMPLAWLGLRGARLDIRLKWQDSTVIDPVTGATRVLSGENGQNAYRTLTNRNRNNRYYAGLDFRQDFEQAQAAWGWTIAERDERPLYLVNELDRYYENAAIDAFIESSRWFGLKIRFDIQNLADDAQERERVVYTGKRGLSPPDYRLLNDRHIGRRLVLSFSGSF